MPLPWNVLIFIVTSRIYGMRTWYVDLILRTEPLANGCTRLSWLLLYTFTFHIRTGSVSRFNSEHICKYLYVRLVRAVRFCAPSTSSQHWVLISSDAAVDNFGLYTHDRQFGFEATQVRMASHRKMHRKFDMTKQPRMDYGNQIQTIYLRREWGTVRIILWLFAGSTGTKYVSFMENNNKRSEAVRLGNDKIEWSAQSIRNRCHIPNAIAHTYTNAIGSGSSMILIPNPSHVSANARKIMRIELERFFLSCFFSALLKSHRK